MQRVASVLANCSLKGVRSPRASIRTRTLCTVAAETRANKIRIELPQNGETVEFIFKQRRQVSKVIDVDPIASRVFVEATSDFSRGPILVGGQSLSCNYGKIDVSPQQITEIAKKELDNLKSLAPQLYERMKNKPTFILEEAFAFIAPRMKPQRNLTAADQRAIALHTTQLLIARYWTLFGSRGHGIYYCPSPERVKVLQLQQRALFDRQLTDRFVSMVRPLVTALLTPLMPAPTHTSTSPPKKTTAEALPNTVADGSAPTNAEPASASEVEVTLAAKVTPLTPEQISVARNQVVNDRPIRPLFDLLQRVACSTEAHELMDGLVYLRLLRPLGLRSQPSDVAALLTTVGVWDQHTCPPELRLSLEDVAQHGPVLTPPKELGARVAAGATPASADPAVHSVLTRTAADPAAGRVSFMDQRSYAIDDDSTTEVDDAVSIERVHSREGEPLDVADVWLHIHIASPASFDHVAPNTPADLAARRRASTIYLPHRRFAMFPSSLVQLFTLAPDQPCTALTFSARLDSTGALVDYRVQPSLVNVTRVNYYHVEQVLNDATAASDVRSRDLHELYHVAQLRRQYRAQIGARLMNLPDPDVKVSRDGDNAQISLIPNTTPKSRVLVEELMVLAGELAARFALERQMPVPLRVQVKPELPEHLARDPLMSAADPSPLVSLVRELRALPYSTVAVTTAGSTTGHYSVGLDTYARVTSPIRRYADLVFQHQFYAQLRGQALPFSAEQLLQLLQPVDATSYYIQQLQQRCERYWKYKYLALHPHQLYYAVVLDVHTPPATWSELVDTSTDRWTLQPRASLFVPALGLIVHVPADTALRATEVVVLRPSPSYNQQTFFHVEHIVREDVPTIPEMMTPICVKADVQK